MSALDTITRLVKSGEEIIAGDDIYGGILVPLSNSIIHTEKWQYIYVGTNRLLAHVSANLNIKVHHLNLTIPNIIDTHLNPEKTRLVLLETPTNPLIKIIDIASISERVHRVCPRALVVVDNTMMSPILMSPLKLGADIEYHSGTKFLSGHHDLMAGVIAVKEKELGNVRRLCLPFDCVY
jgi:cysteine-S-conjugate beta-lyase